MTGLVVERYLESARFNGTSVTEVVGRFGGAALATVERLIADGRLLLEWGLRHENPHVHAFPPEPIDDQLLALAVGSGVLYPTATMLNSTVSRDLHMAEPFTRELALGAAQLDLRFFELTVLEPYRNDPKFEIWTSDFSGSIRTTTDAHDDPGTLDRDKLMLRHFGLARHDGGRRAATACLWYLNEMTGEHQQRWRTYQLSSVGYIPHEGFVKMMLGSWDLPLSIFDALVGEMRACNQFCERINWPRLFRDTNRPSRLGWLYRPSAHEFGEFIRILDGMLSDNLDVKALRASLAKSGVSDKQANGQPKGSLLLLDDLLRYVAGRSPEVVRDIMAPLREIRKLRNPNAHRNEDDRLDPTALVEQERIVEAAYRSVEALRIVLSSHPDAAGFYPSAIPEGPISF